MRQDALNRSMHASRRPSPPQGVAFSRHVATLFAGLCALTLASGCASTNVSDREQLVEGPLPRPGQIWVHDFASTADAVPAESTLAQKFDLAAPTQTSEQLALGRELGTGIATELVQKIRDMGMPAARAGMGTMPQIDDLVIRGYLVSIEPGSAAERVAIGFGAGGSELRTVVDGFQMTPQGLRKLGSGTVEAGGSKGPGAAVGAAAFVATANPVGLIVGTGLKAYGEASGSSTVEGRAKATAGEIAQVLQKRFQEQGWID